MHEAVRDAPAGEYLTISKVNSDEQIISMLDNSGQLTLRSPMNILIGGQVLDGGVTLANLIGFYYGRRPNKFQHDAVLQHSRMYGYRRDDLAVTRFYTSAYILQAMFEMEAFEASLRSAIEAGGDQGVQVVRQAANGKIVQREDRPMKPEQDPGCNETEPSAVPPIAADRLSKRLQIKHREDHS